MTSMKNYILLFLSFLLLHAFAYGQKDPVKQTATVTTTVQKITTAQEQWLRQNYQHLVTMKKDSARMEIKENFPSASKSSVEAMMSRAGKLLQEDKQKHQVQVQQMTRSLTAQKTVLTKQIAEKEKELKKTKDAAKIKSLKDEIAQLKNKVKDLDKEIKYLHDSK